MSWFMCFFFFFFQAEDGIRDVAVTGVQTCALPISLTVCHWQTVKAREAEVHAIGASADEARHTGSLDSMPLLVVSRDPEKGAAPGLIRSEEHTSELQSRLHLVCRLLLEKKKKNPSRTTPIIVFLILIFYFTAVTISSVMSLSLFLHMI